MHNIAVFTTFTLIMVYSSYIISYRECFLYEKFSVVITVLVIV